MPKRKRDDKIERYRRKIQRLEQKSQRRRYRRIISSSDSEQKSDIEAPTTNEVVQVDVEVDALPNENSAYESTTAGEPAAPDEPMDVPVLDPEILSALGETTPEVPNFGPKIHESLARLWQAILRKGLNKETKDKLYKEYLVPENCALLRAPVLNPEISAAVPDASRTRDKRVERVQQQLGLGVTAINKGLGLLLDGESNRLEVIKYMSDGCRLLCDLHFLEGEARKKFVTPGLDKSFLNIIQEVERDDMLFGNKLSDQIKAAKIIEKQGLQIKKPVPTPKLNSSSQSQLSSSRSRSSGNWMGPPRYSSRGGKGGAKRGGPVNRGRFLAAPAQTKSSSGQAKQRVTNQQQ